MTWIRDMPINTKTDRDAETPNLLEFVETHKPYTLLDIGAHWSHAFYAEDLRRLVDTYHAIDVLPDEETADVVDEYIVGNANTHKWQGKYEMVVCVSTIEHAGLSTYKGNPKKEREELFQTILKRAASHAWVSFPAGQGEVIDKQMQTISAQEYTTYLEWADFYRFKVNQRFFYTQGAQAGHPWREHDDSYRAFATPYVEYIGNQSICVMEMSK